jgi:pyruvate,water dikinase
MNLSQQQPRQPQHAQRATEPDAAGAAPIVLPFTAVRHNMLTQVGGKGANLGELAAAGLPVTPGFCVTTAAYEQAAAGAGLADVFAAHTTEAATPEQLAALAYAARESLLQATIPPQLAGAITTAYAQLSAGVDVPVAVRSSATAEDLPFASFAGQQDTELNVVGAAAVLESVRRCWASLWNERAVSYRASLGLDQRGVRLAVVVQTMVQSEVAGVLFTANPITGKRRQAVIDANPGLGEAVVSGATNPDHFVVNTASGEIVERLLGDKRVVIRGAAVGGVIRHDAVAGGSDSACLSDEQIRELAQLGARVEAHYGAPQDIEWAIDAAGALWLTQSRPITTLYPLPASAPQTDANPRVYFSFNVFQGVFGPLTPMGIALFHFVGSSVADLFGLAPRDRLAGPGVMVDAGARLFGDFTSPLRTKFGRRLLIGAANFGEARSGVIFQRLTADPRFALKPTPRWRVARAFGLAAIKTRLPLRILRALLKPSSAVARIQRARANLEALTAPPPPAHKPAQALNLGDRLRALERFVSRRFGMLLPILPPLLIAGMGSLGAASRLLRGIATPEEMQIVTRALPHNPTTEMDLELWALSRRVATDAAAARHLSENTPEQLAQEYHASALPAPLQEGLAEFLRRYGHRSVAEIDIGVARWREDPTHILGVLANYLRLSDPALAPDALFARGKQEAEAMVAELTRRAQRKGRLRGRLVAFFLGRMRALAGLREMPKFCIILLFSYVRVELQQVGASLATAGRLDQPGDIFFITLREAHAACAGADMRAIVRERRAGYNFEARRRHIPRILLSDGTEPAAQPEVEDTADTAGVLRGVPASPGRVTGIARVILDPTGAHLEVGEILVAPSTDPGWTPLFLTAGGLVMEMGGAISHGAVVAREYGIPAVVGVPSATERISTGQRITVDGAAGVVTIAHVE